MPGDSWFLSGVSDKDDVQVSRKRREALSMQGTLCLGPRIALGFRTGLLLRVLFSAQKASSKSVCPLVVFNPRFRSLLEI